MGGLCGLVTTSDDERTHGDAVRRMAEHLTLLDGSKARVVTGRFGALAAARQLGVADVHRGSGYLAAIAGRCHWTDPHLQAEASNAGHAAIVARGYRERGNRVLDSLRGRFALAVLSEDRPEVCLAVDRLGLEPLAYTETDRGLLFASSAATARLAIPDRHPGHRIDPQSIFDYLYLHQVPAPFSAFQGFGRLRPGEWLELRDGRVRREKYWRIRYREDRGDLASARREFIDLVRASVEREASDRNVGAFLSGGTDSSTVSGFLSGLLKAAGSPAKTYSIGFDEPGYNELDYSRIAVRHFGTEAHEYFVTPEDVLELMPQLAEVYAEPFGNASAVPAYYCARMAREDGISLLLAGDGGDELFGGNERYGKQHLFALYDRVPGFLRHWLLEPLGAGLAENRLALLAKLGSYLTQAAIPLPHRLNSYNLLDRLGIRNVLDTAFLEGVDADRPRRLWQEEYEVVDAEHWLNKVLGLDLKFTLADSDIPKVSRMCELAGVDVAYPLLSEELVTFSAKLRHQDKVRGTRLRPFFKDALADFLPQEIILKQKHGFGLPIGPWIAGRPILRDYASERLRALGKRGIVRPDFIDELLQIRLPSHPQFYGTMVWLLVVLEEWMCRHVDGWRREGAVGA